MKKSYPAIIFRQRTGSPLQVAFAAPSAEIDAWARVPTKRTGNIRNFQRAELGKHSNEIHRFFTNQNNSSPTAVVVGFDPIRSAGRVTTHDEKGDVLIEQSVVAGEPIIGSIQIEWADADDVTTRDDQIARIVAVAPAIRKFIYSELNDITGLGEGNASIVERYLATRPDAVLALDTASDESSQDEPEASETSSESTDDNSIGPDASPEVLVSLQGLSPSERQVITGRLKFLSTLEKDSLGVKSAESVAELFRMVVDELKPGILIDGQHRVMGTKKSGQIPFLVTALPSAQWSELAFQFIVTNRTARRVPESLLISIVGNSLSKVQREQIQERLRDAGIKVGLIEAVMLTHEDAQSPFYGYLAFGLKDERGFLDAAAMRTKVVQPWYERQGPVEYLFDHFCEGKQKSERTEFWKSEDLWFEYFVAFWTAVRTRYEGSAVFSFEVDSQRKPTSKLMTATVLMLFQHVILRYLEDLYKGLENAQNVPVSAQLQNATQFQDTVRNTLQKLTPDFFTEWQISGFDGSRQAGEDLKEAILWVVTGKKSVAQLKDKRKPHRLFKEQSK